MIIRDLWKYYGSELVFQEVQANIGSADRIGLVGANGAGKTTLLKVLAGKESPDQGSILQGKDYTVGFLAQTLRPTGQTLLEYLEEPFQEQIELIRAMRALEKELATQDQSIDFDGLIRRYAEFQDRFEHRGGYDYLVRIRGVATGLGFSEDDLERELKTFSGGERMRVSLGRLLLANPSLLLLDEPTNYLDVTGIQWLESYLGTYSRAFIVVSHDRYFLDKVASRIWEIDNHRLEQYRGNYSQYISERKLRRAQLEEAAKRQEEEKRRMEGFISKFGAGTRARQAKSIAKKIERLPEIAVLATDPELTYNFEPKQRSGQNIVTLENLGKEFNGSYLFRGINAKIKKGQRIALLGANGSGKSTLLKILAGKLDFQGKLRWGTGVDASYFSQEITFKGNNTVLEELYQEHGLDLGVLRSVLGRFLFSGEDVFKKTEILSGGERNRLALAKLLLHRSNFLLLDEPTNHLDVFAREALENALSDFSGTILFVSHDRYFIDRIADRIWLLEAGCLWEYEGNFSYYEQTKEKKTGVAKKKQEPKTRYRKKREGLSKWRLERERESVEKEIAGLEQRKQELEEELVSPQLYQSEARSVPLVREYQEIEEKLEQKYQFWESLVDRLQKGRI